MPGPPFGATGAPAPKRQHPRGRASMGSCSCDFVVELAQADAVAALLAVHRVDHQRLVAARGRLHRNCEPEPADWRARLQQRGGPGLPAPLSSLLAVTRSADAHAFRLLENLGVSCSRLRKEIIEHARDRPATPTAGSRRNARAGPARSGVGPPAPRPDPVEDLEAAATEPVPSPVAANQPLTARAPTAPQDDGPRDDLVPLDPDDLAPLAGRELELCRIADALVRAVARPPLLVGPAGCGRSLLATHLARALPYPVFRLLATDYDDDESLREDLDEVADRGGIAILDDLDQVPGDLAPPFLPVLARVWSGGGPPVLTVVSPQARTRLASWLPGLANTLDVIELEPLLGEGAAEAVRVAAPGLLGAHGLHLEDDAIVPELTRAVDRYLGGLAMPGRALDVLDLACARSVRQRRTTVKRATVLDIVAERSGLPRERIESGDDQTLLDLETRLGRRVVGHEDAIATIAGLIRRNRAGFSSGRPVATALLLGPSGVGKTEIAKALAAALYDRPDALVRLDMSEYAEAHAVARVVGAPPGYVGHEQGGALTDPMLARPHCVVLLDEIEKAHRDVHQLLLQVFDDGRLTDGRGRTVDFRHAVVIMTSNLGSDLLHGQGDDDDVDEDEVLAAARAAFPVELWNRIEAPLVMRPLEPEHLRLICKRLAKASSERLFRERGIRYSLSESACDYLIDLAGADRSLGARPLRHLLAREVEAALADAILRARLRAGTQVMVDESAGRLVLR